ncbi:hypothetical protein [Streptomyces sp. NRRL F-5135]|uniref:hypothetical protein n=1 Tax=Streptomyces sp. NRRL F-5135 TaxID=1463858 RepID=UPI0004C8B7B3|nr:hypothetical protein [Streptomyces sp. NRRL F-5135]
MSAITLPVLWVRLVLDGPGGSSTIVAEVPRRGAVAAQKWRTETATWCKYNPPADGYSYRLPLPSRTPRMPAPEPAPTSGRRRRRRCSG